MKRGTTDLSLTYLFVDIEWKELVKQINFYLQSSSLLEINQYRNNHNTETALLKNYNIYLCQQSRKSIYYCLVWSEWSFWHDRPWFSYQQAELFFWFWGVDLNWFKSNPCDRTQSVVCGDFKSSSHPLSFGVPQGGVQL